jgi:hypothetical protein
MSEPEKSDELPSHDSLFGQAAAETAPGPIVDHEPLPPPPPEKKIVVRRGGTPLLLTLLIAAGLGGGIYWVWTNPQHPQPQEVAAPGVPAVDTDTQAKLQALADRVDKLEKAPPPQLAAAPPTQGDTDTPAKLQALADRLDKLEKAPPPEPAAAAAPPAADATVDLSKKLDDLTAQVSSLSAKQDELSAGLSKAQEIAAQKPAEPTLAPDHSAQELAAAAAIQAQQQVADLGGKTNQALSQEKVTLDALEQRLGKLEQTEQADQTKAQEQSSGQITALDSRVGKLEQSAGQLQGVSKDATLAVKLEAAQAAFAAGRPIGDLPDAPPALQRFAATPPPTEAGLRAQFAGVSAAVLAASRPEEAQTTFFSRALARVEQSVTVRQGDHVIVGDPAAGVIARAQASLNEGDLGSAINALSALTGRAADAAKSWRDQAQAYLAARAALLSMAAHG